MTQTLSSAICPLVQKQTMSKSWVFQASLDTIPGIAGISQKLGQVEKAHCKVADHLIMTLTKQQRH